jgi:cell division protein FtsW
MVTMTRAKPLAPTETFVRAPARPLNTVLLATLGLLCIGILMMTSASVEIASSATGDAFYYFKRQAIFACIGLCAGGVTLALPLALWRRFSLLFMLGSFVLLIAVLVPGIGKTVNGSTRWIDLGLFDLQPSEPAKLFIVMFLADFLQRNYVEVRENWREFFIPLIIASAASILLQMEPDHGALVILFATTFCLLFLAGAKILRVLSLVVVAGAGFSWIAYNKAHVIARFTSFMDPWAEENVYGDGYQLAQSLIAFGRGEWFGTGLGQSIQKLYFLPEAHTDFVLAIIGEEFGLLGVAIVIGLFCVLVVRAFAIGRMAERKQSLFAAFFAYGLGLLFAGQTLINVGVNIGLLPTKGLTLPFLSYGGASLIMSCVMAAMLIRIQYETESLAAPAVDKPSGLRR